MTGLSTCPTTTLTSVPELGVYQPCTINELYSGACCSACAELCLPVLIDERTQFMSTVNEIILLVCYSCFVLQMSRSSSTFSLNDSAKTSAVVQRSNSLDQPSLRTRVPVFICTPCTPVKIPSHSTSSQIDSESSKDLSLNGYSVDQESKCISPAPCTLQPNFSVSSPQNVTTVTQVTSTYSQAIQCSIQRRNLHLKSSRDMSRPLSTANLQARTPASQPDDVKIKTFSESNMDLQALSEPCKAVLTSPRRETLL